jgi:hypothetical protein
MKRKPTNDRDRREMLLIGEIAGRAMRLYESLGHIEVQHATIVLDLMSCHYVAQPLRLAEMLFGRDSDFLHDVAGINRHLDRETLKLKDCFLPRFAKLATAPTITDAVRHPEAHAGL